MKNQWRHAKYPNKVFTGTTRRVSVTPQLMEMPFMLVCGRIVKSFESWQAAVGAGWVRKKREKR